MHSGCAFLPGGKLSDDGNKRIKILSNNLDIMLRDVTPVNNTIVAVTLAKTHEIQLWKWRQDSRLGVS